MNRIVKTLNNLAQFDSVGRSDDPQRSVYIIEVVPKDESCKFKFYVGSTWHPVEYRYEEHKSGGSKAAHIFRRRATVGEIRWDLMEGFPKFHSTAAVERAERRVALWLERQGFSVKCNMLNKD
jgi:predicted GIY-YIG superfamily endonuclease